MNIDYWQGRLNEALQKARDAQSARTCIAYLELAAHYRSMVELVNGTETSEESYRETPSLQPDGLPSRSPTRRLLLQRGVREAMFYEAEVRSRADGHRLRPARD